MTKFLATDFYPQFLCKCAACRACCCVGWDVSITMPEYFRLIGLSCSKALRKKLDTAFHLAPNPAPERYALLSRNHMGDCPLRGADGLCALHKERGAQVLPAICRLYPRAIVAGYANECSLSGSCEAVIELLLAREEPIGFVEMDINSDALAPIPARNEGVRRYYRPLRALVISILQDRRYRISERMMRLGRVMQTLHKFDMARDWDGMGAAIAHYAENPSYDAQQVAFGQDVTDAIHKVTEVFAKNSENLHEFWEAGEQNLARANYPEMRRAFEETYPEWEHHIEQITVNHVFFSRFPYNDLREDLWGEYAALCAAHCVVLYISTLYTYGRSGIEPLADVIAAAFRMIEHSDFDRRGHIVCERLGLGTQDKLDQLLCAL